jgi:4-amino-4-deoxy-L-arabinose transferase-like glycosyltransferase
MKMHKLKHVYIPLGILLLVAIFIRVYQISEVPSALHADEASQGYNALSLLKTGRDMYGERFPTLFLANGSYQPPLYTYLTVVPTLMLGQNIFSLRVLAAVSGFLLVVISFFVCLKFGIGRKKDRILQALFSALVISISPWSVFFSRFAVESGLSLTLFVAGVYMFLLSLKRKNAFSVGCLVFAVTTYTYYSERIISIIFILFFLVIFRKYFMKRTKEVVTGLLFLFIAIFPNLLLIPTGAFTKRLMQVSSLNQAASKGFSPIFIGDLIKSYFAHYFAYFSPKNLFFLADAPLGRVTSDLAVFYPWFIIPFLFGLGYLIRERSNPLVKTILLLIIISPIPAGITGDVFYMWRVLVFFWAISMGIAFGIFEIWRAINNRLLASFIITTTALYSVFTLYVSYFVISKYENQNISIHSYQSLLNEISKRSEKQIIIDGNPRLWDSGMVLIYLSKQDPAATQAMLSPQIQVDYYNSDLNGGVDRVGNIKIEPIDWVKLCGRETLIVGDKFSVSEEQVKRNQLKSEFLIYNLKGDPEFYGYSTYKSCPGR